MLPTQLRTFYAVAREGSFTAAARVLHVSQPTLTSQIQKLESSYGIDLFRRHGRGVELTETGKQLLQIAHRIISNQDEAVTFLRSVNSLEAGHLKIGAVGPYQAAEILAVFRQSYPGIKVSVNLGNSRDILKDVIDYRADIGIVGRHTNNAMLYSLTYSNPQPIVIVPQSHLWSDRDSVCLSELSNQKMIRRELGSLTRDTFESALARENVTVKFVLEISSKDGIVAAVAQNIGIGVISEDEHIQSRHVHALRISDIGLKMQVLVVCHADRSKARLINAFFEVAAKTADR